MILHETVCINDDLYGVLFKPVTWPSSSFVYLIKDQDGLTIIDTGIGTENIFSSFLGCLSELGFDPSLIHTIILTHAHTDHIGGIARLRLFSNPKILIPEKDVLEATDALWQENYIMPTQVRAVFSEELKGWDLSQHFFEACGQWILEDDDNLLLIKDGDEIQAGRYLLKVIHVPGHDIGEMAYWVPERKLLFVGDLLKASGTGLPWYSRTSGGIETYLKSLRKIGKLSVDLVLPSHGVISKGFEETVIQTRKVIVNREEKILKSLRNASKSFKELDRILFPEWFWKICPWASSVTDAHLLKLEMEGSLREENGRYLLGCAPSHLEYYM